MRERLFLFLVLWAWFCVPRDWCFYSLESMERSIYESVRRAIIDIGRLKEKRRTDWDRIRSLFNKGTRP